MESFHDDIYSIFGEITALKAKTARAHEELDKRINLQLQNILAQSDQDTPVKPSKKKAKSRLESKENTDTDDAGSDISSTSSRAIHDATTTASNETQQIETETLRPVRTARQKIASMKEPSLSTKMRRNGTTETTVSSASSSASRVTRSTVTEVRIKTERISTVSTTLTTDKVATSTVSEATKGIETLAIASNGIDPLVANCLVKIEKSSMIEDMINKKQSVKVTNGLSKRKPTEDEGISSLDGQSEASTTSATSKKSNDSVELIQPPTDLIELDDDDDEQRMPPPAAPPKPKEKKTRAKVPLTTRSTRSKQVKIKQEIVEDESDREIAESSSGRSTASSTASTVKGTLTRQNASVPSTPINTTSESLYEDAVSEQPNRPTTVNDAVNVVATPSSQSDATFVSTIDEIEMQVNDDLQPRATYVVPKNAAPVVDATFYVDNTMTIASAPQTINNETVIVSTQTNATTSKARKGSASSIMTEDDSDSSTLSPHKTYAKVISKMTSSSASGAIKKVIKDIPTGIKSIKQRAEVFEKMSSPTPSRAKQPIDEKKFAKPQVPLKSSSAANVKHLRSNSVQCTSSVKPSTTAKLGKSQSSDEIRKKNLVEKMEIAKLTRDQKQREREERLKKEMMDKEQKLRENQLKKKQEELRKQEELKEKERIRKEKKAAQDQRERDNMRILEEKKAMQRKLQENKTDAMRRKAIDWDFDAIESGDSTDEEEKQTSKRPPVPDWSLYHNRIPYIKAQSKLPMKTVDEFFSVEPRDVNLREIFPKIDDRHLKRNSSAVWNSPQNFEY